MCLCFCLFLFVCIIALDNARLQYWLLQTTPLLNRASFSFLSSLLYFWWRWVIEPQAFQADSVPLSYNYSPNKAFIYFIYNTHSCLIRLYLLPNMYMKLLSMSCNLLKPCRYLFIIFQHLFFSFVSFSAWKPDTVLLLECNELIRIFVSLFFFTFGILVRNLEVLFACQLLNARIKL